MKVKELQDLLAGLDPDLECFVNDYDWGLEPLQVVAVRERTSALYPRIGDHLNFNKYLELGG